MKKLFLILTVAIGFQTFIPINTICDTDSSDWRHPISQEAADAIIPKISNIFLGNKSNQIIPKLEQLKTAITDPGIIEQINVLIEIGKQHKPSFRFKLLQWGGRITGMSICGLLVLLPILVATDTVTYQNYMHIIDGISQLNIAQKIKKYSTATAYLCVATGLIGFGLLFKYG